MEGFVFPFLYKLAVETVFEDFPGSPIKNLNGLVLLIHQKVVDGFIFTRSLPLRFDPVNHLTFSINKPQFLPGHNPYRISYFPHLSDVMDQNRILRSNENKINRMKKIRH